MCCYTLQHTATHCTTATNCNTLQHTATHSNTLYSATAALRCAVVATLPESTGNVATTAHCLFFLLFNYRRELLQKRGAHGRRGRTKVSSLATASLCTMPPRATGSRQCGQTGRLVLRRKGSRHAWHSAECPLLVTHM